jgi:serine/threonine protein kinase
MPGTRIGKFQVLGTLGTGAHSTIFHVRRSADARNYALKVVPINGPADRKYQDQAEHEFRVAQMLDHPNLLKIYSLEAQRDWRFRIRKLQLLLEYVNGRTLDTLKCTAMPKLVQIFAQVAAGLDYMHRLGVFHADLKPGNIMLSRTGKVKILDFGLARVRGELKDRVQGTPEYMAPEQASRKVVNYQTDIFNFAATVYRLTTWRLPPCPIVAQGGLPLDARSWRQLVAPIRQFNKQVPEELSDLIDRCLSFKPEQRPERMAEVKETLDRLAADLVRSPEDRLEAIEW